MKFNIHRLADKIEKILSGQIITLVLSLSCSFLLAQPSIEWQKSYGIGGEHPVSLKLTTDGGYIVVGSSCTNCGIFNYNYWILKLSKTGAIQWQKTPGGSDRDYATSIDQTTDGGYIVAGYSSSIDEDITGNHGNYDYWIVKLTDTGNIQWQKCLGGSNGDAASSIQQTTDGGYIVAGYSNSEDGDVTGNHGFNDYWVVKLSDTGSIQWQRCFGGGLYDEAYSILQTTNGGYIVAGFSWSNNGDVTENHGGYDYWIVKLTDTGNIQWQKCLGGSNVDLASSIQQTTDGGYIVAGGSVSHDGDVTGNHGNYYDYWIVKLNDIGTILWQKSLGGSEFDYANSIQQTADGGYIVAGISGSNDGDVTGIHGDYDYWIVKLTDTGNIQWQKCMGGTKYDEAFFIQQTTDGGYIVVGKSFSNDGDNTKNDDDGIYWVVKLTGPLSYNQFSVYPNPANDFLNIEWLPEMNVSFIEICDIQGNLILSLKTIKNSYRFDVSGLSGGVYIIRIQTDKGYVVKKLLKG